MNILAYTLIVISLGASLNALAQVKVIGYEIPGLHEKGGQGVYDQILHKVALSNGLATLETLPPIRAEKQFENCNNCCLSPANDNTEFYDYSNVVVSTPMNHAKVYIFSPPGKAAIKKVSALKGKRVGARRGMLYGKTFDSAGLKPTMVGDISSNIKKIKDGRLDAFVAFVPDAYIEFEAMGMKPLPHVKNKPVAVHADALVCRGVSKDFLKKINAGIKALNKSGELKAILGDGYVAP